MRGGEKVCIESKGTIPKNSKNAACVQITGNGNPTQLPLDSLEKRGSNYYFKMPAYAGVQADRADATITIVYKQKPICAKGFTYLRYLDCT